MATFELHRTSIHSPTAADKIGHAAVLIRRLRWLLAPKTTGYDGIAIVMRLSIPIEGRRPGTDSRETRSKTDAVVKTVCLGIGYSRLVTIYSRVVSQREEQAAKLSRIRRNRPEVFKGRHFQDELIKLCVRRYLRYSLSYRDLEELMAERGCKWTTRQSRAGFSDMPRS